jgi:tetratricopeptide (TPR) repeat protein
MKGTHSCVDPGLGELLLPYELGLLAPEEGAAFEQHLLECESCIEEVYALAPYVSAVAEAPAKVGDNLRAERFAGETLHAAGVGQSAAQAPHAFRDREPARGRVAILLRWLWPESAHTRLAFSLGAAAVLFVVLMLPSGTEDVSSLARLEPLPWVSLETRSLGSSAASQRFRSGMELYAAGNFADAAKELAEAVAQADELWSDLDQAEFYLGLSLLLERRPLDALSHLEAATASPSPVIADRARWYRAQAHLLLGERTRARELLAELRDGSPGYSSKAGDQLRSLEHF